VVAVTAADGLAFARRGYTDAATAWANDAELVYGPMAGALLARTPELTGQLVLDVGAGTGAVSHRLVAAGAHALAVDASWPMLAHQALSRPPAVVGDISRLPLVDGAVDGAAAAFVLNHLADPVAALVEMRRVVRRGGFIVASVSSIADPPAAKAAIDGVLATVGWEPPEWYRFLKSVDGQLGSAATMRAAAETATSSTSTWSKDRCEPVSPTRATSSAIGLPSRSGPFSSPDLPQGRGGGSSRNALPRWPNSARHSTPALCCSQPAPDLTAACMTPRGRRVGCQFAASGEFGRRMDPSRRIDARCAAVTVTRAQA
jgi:SAM-dependent methyltransferase